MSSQHFKYVLVGAGTASSAAIAAIRRIDPDGAALLVGQEVNRPYNRPALSRDYLLGKTTRAQLFTHDEAFFSAQHVQLHTGCRVVHIDTARRSVSLDNGDLVAFDKLLLATGASPRTLSVPGAALPNVFYLRRIEDADRLHNGIDQARREGRPHSQGRGRAVVIGGGLLAVELVATFLNLGLHVDMVLAAAHPWPRFAGEAAGRFAAQYLTSRGACVHSSTTLLRLEGDGRVQRAVLSSGITLDCDLVVPALGVTPNKDLLRSTPIVCEKAILVDEHCRTSDPDIYAAGDCAAVRDPLFGKYRHLDHYNNARITGDIAGTNMAGGSRAYDGVNSFETSLVFLPVKVWGEPRQVDHRIVRGNPSLEGPAFLEIGIGADGRITQVLALNHTNDHSTIEQLVRRRAHVESESALRDPSTPLASFIA